MWKQPWSYREGFTICGGLFATGIILQIVLGKCSLNALTSPINLYVGGIYLAIVIIMHIIARKSYTIRWMSSYPAAISALCSVALLTVIMGLVRQVPSAVEVSKSEDWLGFSQMLSAYPFVLLFIWFTTLLGLTTLRRMSHFSWRNIPFLLNHLGLFIALFGAILGSNDMERLKMTTQIGKPEWRALDQQQNIVELPLAIELKEFTIDEYPPKLMLIDNHTGETLPLGRPLNILIEDNFSSGHLLDWEIRVKKRIPLAACIATTDTVNFVEYPSIGATYALYLEVTNSLNDSIVEGWVSCGSFLFPYKAISLNSNVSLVMPDREPQRFASDVVIYTQSREQDSTTIEVNKPFNVEGWNIYQLSYDQTKGRWSDISIFELVRDPWLPIVYTGIWMMIAGSIALFALPSRKKEDKI